MARIMSPEDAVKLIKSDSTVMIGGFGNIGNPKKMIDLVADSDVKNLTVIANDLGTPNAGLGRWVTNKKIKKAIGSYFTYNTEAAELYFSGELDLQMVPQGNFVESIRAGGCGIGGFYTQVGVGSEVTKDAESKVIDGKNYILVTPLQADFAILHAKKADRMGNLIYEKTARNFNPVMATAAKMTLVEVEEIVGPGEISPEEVITPFIYVDVLILVKKGEL